MPQRKRGGMPESQREAACHTHRVHSRQIKPGRWQRASRVLARHSMTQSLNRIALDHFSEDDDRASVIEGQMCSPVRTRMHNPFEVISICLSKRFQQG